MTRSLLTLTCGLLLTGLGLPSARAEGDPATAPITSAVVDTDLRSLRGCPLKGVITRVEDWQRVTDGLPDAPPAPDFARTVVALVVVEVPPGGQARVEQAAPGPGDALHVVLQRRDPEPPVAGDPTLRCFFWFLPPFPGGVHLDYRTEVWGGAGWVSRVCPAGPEDRDPARLPALGPDIRLAVAPPPGGQLPAELSLRQEATFPTRSDLPRRVTTIPWPAGGARLGLRFPRVRDGVDHLMAAHGGGLRSQNPLRIRALPAADGSGNPAPIVHTFQLEPVPE